MPRRLAEPRLRIRAALSLHVQLAPRVPGDGPGAPDRQPPRVAGAAGELIVADPAAAATPRSGDGLPFAGGAAGRPDPLCAGVSRTPASPVELHNRSTFNWLLE